MQVKLIIYIICTFIVSVIGGLVPLLIVCVKNKELAHRIINVLAVGAGGLFLGGGLCHVLNEGLENIEQSGYKFHGMPLGMVIAGFTFLFIFFIDRVLVPHSHVSYDETDKAEEHHHHCTTKEKESEEEMKDTHGSHDSSEVIDDHHDAIEIDMTDYTTKQKVFHFVKEYTNVVVIILALSIHSVLAGLGMGASESPTMIFIAIVCHKWADSAMCVLYLIQKKKRAILIIIAVIFFSLLTPVGTIIGYYAIFSLDNENVSKLVQGILCSIAGGSFIFVSIVEVLTEAFEEEHTQLKHHTLDKYLKFSLALIGFIFMACTTLLESD